MDIARTYIIMGGYPEEKQSALWVSALRDHVDLIQTTKESVYLRNVPEAQRELFLDAMRRSDEIREEGSP